MNMCLKLLTERRTVIAQTVLVKQPCYSQKKKCTDYIEKWPLHDLCFFEDNLWTVLYPKPCYNESCYKEVVVYIRGTALERSVEKLLRGLSRV